MSCCGAAIGIFRIKLNGDSQSAGGRHGARLQHPAIHLYCSCAHLRALFALPPSPYRHFTACPVVHGLPPSPQVNYNLLAGGAVVGCGQPVCVQLGWMVGWLAGCRPPASWLGRGKGVGERPACLGVCWIAPLGAWDGSTWQRYCLLCPVAQTGFTIAFKLCWFACIALLMVLSLNVLCCCASLCLFVAQ